MPNLTPFDFWLFPHRKKILCGYRFHQMKQQLRLTSILQIFQKTSTGMGSLNQRIVGISVRKFKEVTQKNQVFFSTIKHPISEIRSVFKSTKPIHFKLHRNSFCEKTLTGFVSHKEGKKYHSYPLKSSNGITVVRKGIEKGVDFSYIKEALKDFKNFK